MSIESTNTAIQSARREFNLLKDAANAIGRGENDVIQFKFGDGGSRAISAEVSRTDKVKGYGWTLLNPCHNRSQSDIDANNATRDKLVALLVKICNVSPKPNQTAIEALPQPVRDALKTGDFDGKGRPLSVRRIRAVAEALESLPPGGNSDDSVPFGTLGGKPSVHGHTLQKTTSVKPLGKTEDPELKALANGFQQRVKALCKNLEELPDSRKKQRDTLGAYRQILTELNAEIEKARKKDGRKAKYLEDFKKKLDDEFWEDRLTCLAKAVQARAERYDDGDVEHLKEALRSKHQGVRSNFEGGDTTINGLVAAEQDLVGQIANKYFKNKYFKE